MTFVFIAIILYFFILFAYLKKVLMAEKELIALLKKVEANCNRKMKTPADYDFLAGVIWDRIHESISSSTLKRMWGYAGKETDARFATKTVLARFLGYKDWDDFVEQMNSPEIESKQVVSQVIRTQNLIKGQKIEVCWYPDRRCVFQYEGGMQFMVLISENSHLQAGDTFMCGIFMLDEPLLLDNVVHQGMQPTPYIAGSKSGLTRIRMVE